MNNFFKAKQGIELEALIADPLSGTPGSFYYNSTLQKLRWFDGTSWDDMGGANKTLSNLLSPTAINQHLLPNIAGANFVGSTAFPWANMNATSLTATRPGTSHGAINAASSLTLPSGLVLADVYDHVAHALKPFVIRTVNSSTANTQTIYAETGNATAGSFNSGDIKYKTGTSAGGIRGEFSVDARQVNVNSSKIVNVADPTAAQDAATKFYVDNNGGGSGINYITNHNAESGTTTGWIVSKNTVAGPDPDNGFVTSGTGILWGTLANQLRKNYSFLLTKDAANRQGEQAYTDFTIDLADRGKMMQCSFEYKGVSNIFLDDMYSVWFYDITNNKFIQPTPYLIKYHTNPGERYFCEFQTNINSVSYRLIIHCRSTSTVPGSVAFDNLIVGPQAKLYGSAVTDWTEFAPIHSWSSWASISSGFWKQEGDTMKFRVAIRLNAAPTGSLTFTIPSGAIDTFKLPSGVQTNDEWKLGEVNVNDNGSATHLQGKLLYNSPTTVIAASFRRLTDSQIDVQGINPTTPITFASGDSINIFGEVPILGWSSSMLRSSDANTRVIGFSAYAPTNGAIASGNSAAAGTLLFGSINKDDAGSYNASTGVYTVTTPGWYHIEYQAGGTCASASADNQSEGGVYLDGTSTNIIYGSKYADGTNNRFHQIQGSRNYYLTSGQNLRVIFLNGYGANWTPSTSPGACYFSINLISGPAQIMASEKVAAVYRAVATSLPTGTFTVLQMDTKVTDTHGMVATGASWRFTAPKRDIYTVSAAITMEPSGGAWTTGNQVQINIFKNGSDYHILNLDQANASASYSIGLSGVTVIELNAGEYIDLRGWQNSGVTQSIRTGVQSHISISSGGF